MVMFNPDYITSSDKWQYACRMDGMTDGVPFIQILDDELQESFAHYSKSPQDIIYQQDNDPKHTCKKAQK